jgi:small GTP-binding protein
MGVVQKKVCMLGSFAVGKTSLVSQYVSSIFSDTYTTTIGVKIDKKSVDLDNQSLSLVLWDVYGEDNHQSVLPAYLRGMAGYILVVDLTRPSTLSSAKSLQEMVDEKIGSKPFVLALNKSDIKDKWIDGSDTLQALNDLSVKTVETSAKNDTGVNELFESLALALVSSSSKTSK